MIVKHLQFHHVIVLEVLRKGKFQVKKRVVKVEKF